VTGTAYSSKINATSLPAYRTSRHVTSINCANDKLPSVIALCSLQLCLTSSYVKLREGDCGRNNSSRSLAEQNHVNVTQPINALT